MTRRRSGSAWPRTSIPTPFGAGWIGFGVAQALRRLDVIPALVDGFLGASGDLPHRLLEGLIAAQAAGSDSRGLFSAALLVVGRDRAPLTLRIDHSEAPLAALAALHRRATSGDYARWAAEVPTLQEPERATPCAVDPIPR